MSIHLNDLSKVYLEKVALSEAEVQPPMERLKTDRNMFNIPTDEKNAARERALAKSKAMRDKKKLSTEALDPVGQEDADIDNDGKKNDKNDKYLSRRRKVVARAIANKKLKESKNLIDDKTKVIENPVVKEYYSNWREDLKEIVDNSGDKKIKEKKVNNKVVINPEIKENIQIVESYEISEEYIQETVDIATEYFYEQGLNDEGLDILIENIGLDSFVEFVFSLQEEFNLIESRTLVGKKTNPAKGKELGISRKAAPGKTTKAAVAKHGTTRNIKSNISSTIKKNRPQIQKSVEKAKTTQSSKKPVRDAIARGIFRAVDAYKSGMERHRAATKTAGKALKVAGKAANEFGKGVASGVKATGKAAKAAHKVLNNSYELNGDSKEEVNEKITSKTSKEKIIRDFVKSDDPKFKGDTKKERINRALGAWYSMHKSKKVSEATEADTVANTQMKPDEKNMDKKKQDASKRAKLNKILQARKNLQMIQQQALRSGVSDIGG